MPIKTLEEYKVSMKEIMDKGKSFEYAEGYVTCLMDSDLLNTYDALELLNYVSDIYFKKMGWK